MLTRLRCQEKKAYRFPPGDGLEVEKELTGRETEPWEIVLQKFPVNLVAQSSRAAKGGLQARGGEGTDREGNRGIGVIYYKVYQFLIGKAACRTTGPATGLNFRLASHSTPPRWPAPSIVEHSRPSR